MVKKESESMFNYLYQKFADMLGEDVAIEILEMTGFVPIEFKNQ